MNNDSFFLDSSSNLLDCVRGMKVLDRTKFNKTLQITCLIVQSKDLNIILKLVKPFIFKKPHFQAIVHLGNGRSSIVLNPEKSAELLKNEKFVKMIEEYRIEFEENQITLGYENYSSHEILSAVLSEVDLGLLSYSVIGHIIHLNLRDEFEPYKSLIGQVLLDKSPQQSLVLNKTDKIDTTFRYFNFDILARRDESVSTVVQVNEYGIRFRMDFAKVYWNPRLSTEHNRIIELLDRGDTVYDVFAGIGPFAIPACKKKCCFVFANDLNPESYKYLCENVKLNKVDTVKSYNLDGREFITEVVKQNLLENWIKSVDSLISNANSKFHVIMNLPAIAVEFLDAFIGLTVDKLDDPSISELYRNDKLIMPKVYCYCFHSVGVEMSEMLQTVKTRLNCDTIEKIDICFVRKVAPNKDMYRLTFNLPKEVLFADKSNKRQKTK